MWRSHSAVLQRFSFRDSFTHKRHTVEAHVTFMGSSSSQCLLNVGLCCWMADLAQVLYIKIMVKIKKCDNLNREKQGREAFSILKLLKRML